MSAVTMATLVQPNASAAGALRVATRDVHERLHGHPAFAPLLRGDIDRAGYAELLLALHGFHRAFAHLSPEGPVRCALLVRDLHFLGIGADTITHAPVADVPVRPAQAARWGIDYVLRGASLGGRVLARKLDGLLGTGTEDGRRFFLGEEGGTGSDWRAFLQDLELALPGANDRLMAGKAALTTFEHFEAWMNTDMAVKMLPKEPG